MATCGAVAHRTLKDDDTLDFTRIAGAGGEGPAAAAAVALKAGPEAATAAAAVAAAAALPLLPLPAEPRLVRWGRCVEFQRYT